MRSIPIDTLKNATLSFLEKFFPSDVAQDCVDVIFYAELRGKTGQGLLKLLGTEPLQSIKSTASIEIIERTKLSASINGNKNPSFCVAKRATDICIKKANDFGVGIVGVNGIYSSTGALGFYTEKAAKEGLVSYCCARSPGSVAPFGMSIPLFGTNPFSWAFPTNNDPIVFDMATSAITFYELVLAKMRGENIPQGVAVDKEGNLTQYPHEAMRGGILPFDKGYKGSALSMMVEILSGPLVGSSYCDYQTFDKDWGFFIMSFQPNLLVEKDEFIKGTSDIAGIIRQNNADAPSDRGRKIKSLNLKKGTIDVEDSVAALLRV
jgi:L-2-hydroxycarboxylate dehydrogenase (NAD+)